MKKTSKKITKKEVKKWIDPGATAAKKIADQLNSDGIFVICKGKDGSLGSFSYGIGKIDAVASLAQLQHMLLSQ